MVKGTIRTPLLAGLIFAGSIAAAFAATTPSHVAQNPVRLHLTPMASGIGIDVRTNARRPLVVLVNGHVTIKRTTKSLHLKVPTRLVRRPRVRVAVRDAHTRKLLVVRETTPRALAVSYGAPQLTLIAAPPASTTATTASLAWTTTASRVSCTLDAGSAAPCTSPYTVSGLALGQHTVTVTASRSRGTSSVSASWTVAAAPPPPANPAPAPTPAPAPAPAPSPGAWALADP